MIAPTINRKPEEVAGRLLVGSAEHCASIVRAYGDAGVQRIYVWPVADELPQLQIVRERVLPLAG